MMGDFHNKSSTAKATCAGSLKSATGMVHFAVSSMQGRRTTQEDAHVIETELRAHDVSRNKHHDILPDHALFAVFDGHGTSFASNYAAKHFVSTLCRQKLFVDYSQSFFDRPQSGISARKKKGNSASNKSQKKHSITPGGDDKDDPRILLEDAIKSTMLELDANMLEEITTRRKCREDRMSDNHCSSEHEEESYDESDSGTTAIVVILTPQYVICANLGDCRAILLRGMNDGIDTTTISLSTDHKPNDELEELRIRNAGGVVLGGLIEGRLAVSRGLGDFDFKHTPSVLHAASKHNGDFQIDAYVEPDDQMVSSVPEITLLARDDAHDKFLAIACDGIWDVLSNEKCATMVSTIFHEGEESLDLACEEVLDQCYAKGSLDNMSAILIKFGSQEIGFGGGVMKRRNQRWRKGR